MMQSDETATETETEDKPLLISFSTMDQLPPGGFFPPSLMEDLETANSMPTRRRDPPDAQPKIAKFAMVYGRMVNNLIATGGILPIDEDLHGAQRLPSSGLGREHTQCPRDHNYTEGDPIGTFLADPPVEYITSTCVPVGSGDWYKGVRHTKKETHCALQNA